jgi:putative nucleotidyltransferase with HDIG domain
MITKIPIAQLKVGMYIHDINCSWLKHNFVRNRFLIDSLETLQKVRATGVKELFIDPTQSVVPETAAVTAAAPEPVQEKASYVPVPVINGKATAQEGFRYAKQLYGSANKLMQDMMRDIRLGKQIELEACEPLVDNIMDSIFTFPSALLPLAQMKNRDEYTFQHSVSVSALAVAFGRVLQMPRDEIKELALGGLLHDVGKAQIPGKILNKPGKLDGDEFAVMRTHASISAELLKKVPSLSTTAFNAAAEHHERFDGTGYPHGLKGDQISKHGQMLAIVDVYDAITSIRVYHKGMPPTDALRKMFEWGGSHFNPQLVQAFVKGIGIYPAGSLVRMESNRLGIVREVVPERLLQPIVQLIYDCQSKRYIHPETVDLATANDKIVSHESFETWQIDQAKWAIA